MNGAARAGGAASGRRGLRRAASIGAVIAAVPFTVVLAGGHASLLQRTSIGGFYEVQARSLMHLRWNVPTNSIAFEAIVHDGKQFMYYGPWPSILRMPLLAVTDRFDGRLTQISMLLAFAVAMTALVSLVLHVRDLVLGDAPVTRAERATVAAFVVLVGAGSSLVFLASRAFVYHEAELWGASLALAAFAAILRFVGAPSPGRAVSAGGLTTLAFLTRASVGAGPVVALGLLLVASATARSRAWVGVPGSVSRRALVVPLGLALAVPVLLYAYVNWAKFGSFYSLPLDQQIFTQMNAARRAALAANGGSLFGLEFLPTTVVQYFRPDAIRPWQLFPWVTFPPAATVIGDVRFDTVDLASSLPASMPALMVLAGVGLVRVVRPRTPGDVASPARVRALVLGATAGSLVTLTIGYVAQRYLSDFLPATILLATVGVFVLVRWSTRRAGASRGPLVVVWGGLAALLVFSAWVNFGLAELYQRQLGGAGITNADLRGFSAFQYDLVRTLPGGRPPYVVRGAHLPRPLARGSVFIVGDCATTYLSDGHAWRALETGTAGGGYRLRVRFPATRGALRQPLVVRGAEPSGQFVGVRLLGGGRVQFGYSSPETGARWIDGPAIPAASGREHDVSITLDTELGLVVVVLDDVYALEVLAAVPPARPVTLGRTDIGGPVTPTFTGDITRLPPQTSLCRSLLAAGA